MASFLLRRATLRAIARMVVLLVVDLLAVWGGLFTATMVKLVFEHGFTFDAAWTTTRHFLAFAYLLTVLAFARLDLYADRPRRPGFSKIATGLFQATLLGLIFSLADGEHFSSYWIFYGSFMLRAAVRRLAA